MLSPVMPAVFPYPTPVGNAAAFAPAGPTVSPPDASSQAPDADRSAFAELMRVPATTAARMEPAARIAPPSVIEKFAATQNSDMRELLQSTRDLLKAAPRLSMGEVMAFGNELTVNVAITTTQFNVAGNLAKSASKGVETLMRNQ